MIALSIVDVTPQKIAHVFADGGKASSLQKRADESGDGASRSRQAFREGLSLPKQMVTTMPAHSFSGGGAAAFLAGLALALGLLAGGWASEDATVEQSAFLHEVSPDVAGGAEPRPVEAEVGRREARRDIRVIYPSPYDNLH